MEEFFVDTNVFLRFFTKDDEKKARAARNLFVKALEGKITLKTSELVIAEIIWTLESYYEFPKEEIQEKVQLLLQSEGLDIPNRNLLSRALVAYVEQNVDFIDAYNAFWAQKENIPKFITYDRKHLKRFAFLEVQEP